MKRRQVSETSASGSAASSSTKPPPQGRGRIAHRCLNNLEKGRKKPSGCWSTAARGSAGVLTVSVLLGLKLLPAASVAAQQSHGQRFRHRCPAFVPAVGVVRKVPQRARKIPRRGKRRSFSPLWPWLNERVKIEALRLPASPYSCQDLSEAGGWTLMTCGLFWKDQTQRVAGASA